MRATGFGLLRRLGVVWVLALPFGAALAVSSVPTPTAAKAKSKGKAKGKKGKGRTAAPDKPAIANEELAPKEDFGLDEEISKTKDLKPAAEDKGPGLATDVAGRGRTLEDVLEDKLDEEIKLTIELLEVQDDCENGAQPRFRLADLYWEKSKRAFFKSNAQGIADKDRLAWEERMKKLQRATIANYQKILDECGDYPDYAKVLFFQGSAYVELDNAAKGAEYFERIIKEYPTTQWVGNAWFMVGEVFFNIKNDATKALRAYKEAEKHKESSTFGYAIYKQGWCYVNTGDWDLALERFRTVVRISDDARANMDKKGRLSLRREGLKDYVRAFSHVGDVKDAAKDFMKLAGKEDSEWMMESLGKWYINNDDHPNVIACYKDLIKAYPKSTRLPLFQSRIVKAISIVDKKSVVPQSKLLTDYFLNIRKRVQAGEFDGDAKNKERVVRDLKEAEEIAENTLRGLASEAYKEAQKLRGEPGRRTWKLAHDLFEHYLTVFPEPDPKAEVNYVFYMRFYFAESLYKLEDFEKAATNYDLVVDMNPKPTNPKEKDIVLGAAENSVHSWRELVEDLDRKNPPKIEGTDPKPIPEVKQRLISSCRRYIDYVGKEGDKIVAIRYQVAYIYYTYNHFTEAAPAFNDIVENHPTHEHACTAANLTLDIYNGQKNYQALISTAQAYVDNKELACEETDRKRFSEIVESWSFKIVKLELEEKAKYLAAANAYLEFYKKFPSSQFADDAVYNAAVNFDLAGRLDKANEVREFLVNKMPGADPALVQETMFNIAQSYRRIVDFAKAAEYLERYAQKYPSDEKSKDALFNAGLYRATLGEFEGARRNREEFMRKYPKDKDIKDVAFSICTTIEDEAKRAEAKKENALKRWELVHDCFMDYAKKFDGKDDDAVCYAQFRRLEIMRDKTKYAKGVADVEKLLRASWPRWSGRNKLENLPRCAGALAEIHFAELQGELKRVKDLTIEELNPVPEKMKKFESSVASKVKARDALIEKYKKVVEFGVAEWALAALYNIGELYNDSVEKLLAAPIPKKVGKDVVPEEIRDELRARLRDMSLPVVESAVEAYRICVNKANELAVYNKWSSRALKRLQEMRPEEFPPLEERIVKASFSDALVVAANNLTIPEGESWRSLDVKVAADGVVPGEAKAAEGEKSASADAAEEADSAGKGKRGAKGKKGGEARP